MGQGLRVFSQKFYLRSVELDPVAALVLDLLHPLLQLQLEPPLALLFLLPQLLLASRPQILPAAVYFLLQVDDFRVSFVDDAEGLLELIVVAPELNGESVAVEVLLGLRFVDFALRGPEEYDELVVDVGEIVPFLAVDPQRGGQRLSRRSFVEFPRRGGVEGLRWRFNFLGN